MLHAYISFYYLEDRNHYVHIFFNDFCRKQLLRESYFPGINYSDCFRCLIGDRLWIVWIVWIVWISYFQKNFMYKIYKNDIVSTYIFLNFDQGLLLQFFTLNRLKWMEQFLYNGSNFVEYLHFCIKRSRQYCITGLLLENKTTRVFFSFSSVSPILASI